jgi:hypothetical protein
MRVQFYSLKQELDDTKEKMRYFTQVNSVEKKRKRSIHTRRVWRQSLEELGET